MSKLTKALEVIKNECDEHFQSSMKNKQVDGGDGVC